MLRLLVLLWVAAIQCFEVHPCFIKALFSADETHDVAVDPPHTRCSTPSSLLKRVEQELLGYFGSSAIYDGLPVLNSTTSHQVNCIHQSRAVMDAMLYPHVPMPETVVASNSNCNILWKPSKLGAALRHPPHEPLKEILAFRWLSERCRTAVDASKGFGREEANLDVFSRDIAELWESTSNSWRSESTTSSTRSAPDRVVFLVFYSHSQHTRAVGKHFISIKDRVVSYLSSPEDQEHGRGPRIVRVVPIIVGIKTPPQILSACLTSSPNELWYRRAGQYTTCSILQCLRELPLVCVGSGDAMSVLQRRVLLVSESWLFARTMAGLTNGPFLSRMEDMRSEVVPGVVSQSLSEAEVEAFARYVAVRAKSCD